MDSNVNYILHYGNSEMLIFFTVQQALRELNNNIPSGRQNLEARVCNTQLFEITMDSKDCRLYGDVNEDGRYRFKEDFSFDLSSIALCPVSIIVQEGLVPIDSDQYARSQGVEFIIIGKEELEGATNSYAIHSQSYDGVRKALNIARCSNHKFDVNELIIAGGFKVDAPLTVDEHVKLIGNRDILELKKEEIEQLSLVDFQFFHAGWHEHFTGCNKATPQQYLEGAKLYVKYVQEASKHKCFENGKGMPFFVDIYHETRVKGFYVCLWTIQDKFTQSKAYSKMIDNDMNVLKIT